MGRIQDAYFPTEPRTAGFVASVTPDAVALRLGINIALSMKDGVARASRRLDFYLLVRRSYTRAFGDGPRNFEPWSSDVDDT
ncbi:hypothetical protein TNCV_523281 [Trichonephila clavipes]|nr:hypothetical protein TNCV_523281 [Trichonephila clavipes]